MRRVSGSVRAFSHSSFATVRVQGPSEQILIDLRVLSIRSVFSTWVNIEPVKGEYNRTRCRGRDLPPAHPA